MPRAEADELRTFPGGEHEPDHLVDGGDTVSVAGVDFGTIAVPGHSPASIAYYAHGFVFSGDVLFSGSVGRTDLDGGRPPAAAGEHRGTCTECFRPRRWCCRATGRSPRSTPNSRPTRSWPSCGHEQGHSRRPAGRATGTWATPARRRSLVDAAAVGVRGRRIAARWSRPRSRTPRCTPRTSGEGSDVVRKEMYTFHDHSDRSLTLRPEGTAGVVRAYIEHGMSRLPQPIKSWYVAPMFRYAAVQRGRFREHYQFGVEVPGIVRPRCGCRGDRPPARLVPAGGGHPVPAGAELDRRQRLPPGLSRSAGGVSGRTRR